MYECAFVSVIFLLDSCMFYVRMFYGPSWSDLNEYISNVQSRDEASLSIPTALESGGLYNSSYWHTRREHKQSANKKSRVFTQQRASRGPSAW